jgi:hypothetical protein
VPPEVFLIALLSTVGIAAFTVIRVTRLIANRSRPVPDDVVDRVEELERALHSVQQELAETQERLDFAERLLSASREGR